MARVTKVENTSGGPIEVHLKGGAKVTLETGTSLHNADIENIGQLKRSAKVTEDLSEIGGSGGKQQINERRPK
jgi:hypothetical protein